jgi:hypothetical protein
MSNARRERLIDGDVDAADPCAVHPDVFHQIAAGIDNGDVHRLADLVCLSFVTTLRITPCSIVFPAGLPKVGKSIF